MSADEALAERSAGGPAPGPAGGMAARTMHGSLWMVLNTLVTRVASFVQQIALGWLLLAEDFGVFGIAIGLATMTAMLRDGGVRFLVIREHDRYEEIQGPTFWIALAFNLLAGVIMVGLGFAARTVYGQPILLEMMAVLAAVHVLSTPGGLFVARLQGQLRFKEVSNIASASAVVRYGGAVAMAAMGFGAMSFVYPAVAGVLLEGVMSWWCVRRAPWTRSAEFRRWPSLLGLTWWTVLGTLGTAAANLGVGVVIGLVLDEAIVGVYYFAAAIVLQIGMLLSGNVNQVLLPVLSRLTGDRSRTKQAVVRAMKQLMVLSVLFGCGLAATYGPLEQMVWREKWIDSVMPVRILAVLYCVNVLMSVSLSLQQSRGDFRRWALGSVGFAAGVLASGLLGAIVGGDATSVAWGSGTFGAVAAACHVRWALGPVGVVWRDVSACIAPSWLLGVFAAGLAIWADMWMLHSAVSVPAWARFLATGVLFCLVYGGLTRWWMSGVLFDAAGSLPARLRGPVLKALLMSNARDAAGGLT